jgi:hypothetical protein
VIPTLFWAGVRERLRRPVVVVLLVVGSGFLLAAPLVTEDPDLQDPSWMMALLFGVGLIGRDVSSGTLALLFTRPIRRWQYTTTRWLAAAAPAAVLSVAHLTVQFVVLAQRGHGVPTAALLERMFEATTICLGLSAVLVALSSAAPGLADLGLWIALQLGVGLGQTLGLPQRATESLEALALPRLEWAIVCAGGTAGWFALASYASNLALLLAVAVWLINRKEISYASSG